MMIALTPRIPICRTAQYFNPHFRKGSDLRYPQRSKAFKHFNPHFHKGSDGMDIMESQQIAISIHTSTREVTARDRGRFGAVIYFNPHFHKGSDCTHHQTPDTMLYFNPHFHKGSDFHKYAKKVGDK